MSQTNYFHDSDLERTLSNFKNRIIFWNSCERLINKRYKPKTIKDIQVDTSDQKAMSAFIKENNKRIEEIREVVKKINSKKPPK